MLFNQSRIPPRLTVLKPLSAAISIGTGGPFGAEGPIIATGSALGSLVGQMIRVTADERKTLLAAGAVAGMAATFGSPVSAVLLAIELLLFEYRPRSVIPVALASATATAVRMAAVGTAPVFTIPELVQPSAPALATYIALVGVVTRADLEGAAVADEALVRDLVKRAPLVISEQSSLREAADRMVTEGVGRLLVVDRSAPRKLLGIITRSDLLGAHQQRIEEAQLAQVVLRLRRG